MRWQKARVGHGGRAVQRLEVRAFKTPQPTLESTTEVDAKASRQPLPPDHQARIASKHESKGRHFYYSRMRNADAFAHHDVVARESRAEPSRAELLDTGQRDSYGGKI